MSSDSEVGSPVRRFIDSFLQEQNIKWILAVGMLILLGSSLMFVTSRWNEATPIGNTLILLAYTAAAFGASEVCYWRLGLRNSGTVLMALTVLLMPISFLALRWELAGRHARAARTLARGNVDEESSRPPDLVAIASLLPMTGSARLAGVLDWGERYWHWRRSVKTTAKRCSSGCGCSPRNWKRGINRRIARHILDVILNRGDRQCDGLKTSRS